MNGDLRQNARMDDAFRKDGAIYLLSLRLIPGIPFFLSSGRFIGINAHSLENVLVGQSIGDAPGDDSLCLRRIQRTRLDDVERARPIEHFERTICRRVRLTRIVPACGRLAATQPMAAK